MMTKSELINNVKDGFMLNPNDKIVESILKALNRNEGYCPCVNNSEDKKCPCSNYRTLNKCCCNLYIPKK